MKVYRACRGRFRRRQQVTFAKRKRTISRKPRTQGRCARAVARAIARERARARARTREGASPRSKRPVTRARGRRQAGTKPKVIQPTARLLRRVAREMMPFSRAVAASPRYAALWSRAVVTADLDQMRKLLRLTAPRLSKNGMGTNGIGYFISFEDKRTCYTCGITIPPGKVQFHFNPTVHRSMICSLLPYYREVECNPRYRAALARAIRRNDQRAATRLIRTRIRSKALKAVTIEDDGLLLSFKYPFSKYKYSYMLYREFA